MATKVVMPQLGESVIEGTVLKWLKAQGESIANMETLLEVETDKVVSEIPSPAAGVLLAVIVPEGTTVKAGTILAWIGEPTEVIPMDEGTQELPGHEPSIVGETVSTSQGGKPPIPTTTVAAEHDLGFVSPVVAKIAREKNVDLHKVKGTGQGGRITKKDILAFIETSSKDAVPIWETPADGDLFRPTELTSKQEILPAPTSTNIVHGTGPSDVLIPHTTIRRSIAEHMLASRNISPHVTTVMEVDLSKVVIHREANKIAFAREGVNLTYTAYFMVAAVVALKSHPMVNSSWSDDGIVVHGAVNIGMATSLGEEGLIVPVIKNADGLSLLGIARAINDLAERARAKKLQPDEVRGGTFTITNHGISGSLFATPIINQPQCGILGVGVIQKRAVVVNDAIAIRSMVYLSLTFDHRILDGASADWFLAKVVETLQNWMD